MTDNTKLDTAGAAVSQSVSELLERELSPDRVVSQAQTGGDISMLDSLRVLRSQQPAASPCHRHKNYRKQFSVMDWSEVEGAHRTIHTEIHSALSHSEYFTF